MEQQLSREKFRQTSSHVEERAPSAGEGLTAHLSLREPQLGRQVRALRQGQILGLLEALVQSLQLQAGVDGPRLPDLLALSVHQPDVPVLTHRGLVSILQREQKQLQVRRLLDEDTFNPKVGRHIKNKQFHFINSTETRNSRSSRQAWVPCRSPPPPSPRPAGWRFLHLQSSAHTIIPHKNRDAVFKQ